MKGFLAGNLEIKYGGDTRKYRLHYIEVGGIFSLTGNKLAVAGIPAVYPFDRERAGFVYMDKLIVTVG